MLDLHGGFEVFGSKGLVALCLESVSHAGGREMKLKESEGFTLASNTSSKGGGTQVNGESELKTTVGVAA